MIDNGHSYFISTDDKEKYDSLHEIVEDGKGKVVFDIYSDNVIIITDRIDDFSANLNRIISADELLSTKKRKRSDEQDNDLCSTESKVSKKELEILDPLSFQHWKEESIASLLCSPFEQGGANLSKEDAKTLYDGHFSSNDIQMMFLLINAKKPLNKQYIRPLISELPTDVKESLVKWVENLFERMFFLWTHEKLLSELCKPIQEGGAGLNSNDLVNIANLEDFIINSSNIENPIEKLIIDWKYSFLIQYEPVFFSNDQFYLNIKKLLANVIDLDSSVQKIYQNCYEQEKSNVKNIRNVPTIEELISLVECKEPVVKLIYTNDTIINELTKEGVKLPIVKKGKEYLFNKHHLPFIPSLHSPNEFDEKVVLEIENSIIPPTFILMSPSGIGKTSLMIRTLCNYPGIFITGTGANENGGTIDLASRKLIQQLSRSQSPSRTFATVRQLCHLLIISKILHINQLIDLAVSDNKLLDPFDGNLFSFLTFNQFNRNTENDREIFEQLFKYEWCEIDDLRKLTIESFKFLKKKLSNINKSDKLVICVDEANVFEEFSPIKFISCGGKERGFLSVLTYEIERLKNDYLKSSFYAGTSFSVDISNVVQSILMKNEAKPNILTLAQFPKLDKKEFFDYVYRHIVLDYETKASIEKKNSFPIRIRQASLFLEKYTNAKLNKSTTLQFAFENAFEDGFDGIKEKIEDFIKTRNTQDYFKSIKDTLFNYIIHFRFGKLFGTSFVEHDKEIASTILTSGLTNPTNSDLYAFEANDYLGYKVALDIIGKLNEEVTVMGLAQFWLQKTKDPKQVEKIIMLCLTQLESKPLKEYFPTSQIKKIEPMFNCHTMVNANGYLEFCAERGIDTKNENGELLYINNIINQKWDLVYGVAFSPSNVAHPDIMLFIKDCDGNPLLLTFSIKCRTGKSMEPSNGFKSTIPYLMYLNNYKKVDLEMINQIEDIEFDSGLELCKHLNELVVEQQKEDLFSYTTNNKHSAIWSANISSIKKMSWMSIIIHIHPSHTFNNNECYPNNVSWIDKAAFNQLFPSLTIPFDIFLLTFNNNK